MGKAAVNRTVTVARYLSTEEADTLAQTEIDKNRAKLKPGDTITVVGTNRKRNYTVGKDYKVEER